MNKKELIDKILVAVNHNRVGWKPSRDWTLKGELETLLADWTRQGGRR